MIQLEEVKQIPHMHFSKNSAKEFEKTLAQGIEKRSYRMMVLRDGDAIIGAAGLTRLSLITAPWLWLLLSDYFEANWRNYLGQFAKLLQELPRPVMATVNIDFEAGARFAKFFGFDPTDEVIGSLRVYRRV